MPEKHSDASYRPQASFGPVGEKIMMTVPCAIDASNCRSVPVAEHCNWTWLDALPIKTVEIVVGEAVAPDWAGEAVAFPACRVPAAYPAARPTSSPAAPRMIATVGGRRQRTGGWSLPCSRMSGPAAGSLLHGGRSGRRQPSSWLLTSS